MMSFIFLDDERVPSDVNWILLPRTTATVVRSLEELSVAFVEAINIPNNLVTISFDHDLQLFKEDGTEVTGRECLWWVINYMITHKISINRVHCLFHTKNPVGLDYMMGLWSNFIVFAEN